MGNDNPVLCPKCSNGKLIPGSADHYDCGHVYTEEDKVADGQEASERELEKDDRREENGRSENA